LEEFSDSARSLPDFNIMSVDVLARMLERRSIVGGFEV
jgi:hypothetical protein